MGLVTRAGHDAIRNLRGIQKRMRRGRPAAALCTEKECPLSYFFFLPFCLHFIDEDALKTSPL